MGASFLWDAGTSPSRLLKQGNDNVIYGLGPLYVVKADATTVTLARDGGKSVRAEVSAAGSVTAAFRYGAYGRTAQSTVGSPSYLAYAGQLLDPSGLYYLRARWYDATTGRFVTRDPASSDPSDPRSLNRFNYGYANPEMMTDPAGLWGGVDDLIAIAGGGLVGALWSIGTQTVAHPGTIDWGDVGISALGGAVFAETTLYAGPVVAGAVSGLVTDVASQVRANGGLDEFDLGEAAVSTAVGGALGYVGNRFLGGGREISFGKNTRISLGNSTSENPTARLAHYHRRVMDELGDVLEGQGIKRHRPWDVKGTDTSFWDRF